MVSDEAWQSWLDEIRRSELHVGELGQLLAMNDAGVPFAEIVDVMEYLVAHPGVIPFAAAQALGIRAEGREMES